MNVISKRAERIAIAALVLSLLFFPALFVMGGLCGSLAVIAVSWQVLGSFLLWLTLVILYHQRSLAEQEKIDLSKLSSDGDTDTIFQANADRKAMFAVAGKRLTVLEKWFVPIFALFAAAYNIGIGLYMFSLYLRSEPIEAGDLNNPLLYAVLMVVVAFLSFLYSRFVTGTSGEKIQWRSLRAGSSSMLATAVLAFVLSVALALAQFKMIGFLAVMAGVVPVVLIVLGAEIALNCVLDIYRPRIAGQYSRMAIDSRLLGMINEPVGILHTFSSAIDYQFGFKVSQTWFYKLIAKAVIPLIIFSMLAMYVLTCFVSVSPEEQGIIERFGSAKIEGKVRLIGPGLHSKLPWPFDKVQKQHTDRIHQIIIGHAQEDENGEQHDKQPFLWGEKHFGQEYNLLVAAVGYDDTTDAQEKSADQLKETVPVSIVNAMIPVQFVIDDLYAFLYNHRDAEEMLEAICYRQLSKFAASAKIETEGDDDPTAKKFSLLGAGRQQAAEQLRQSIQTEADRAGLGIKLVFLGLEGVHPPAEVAAAYQEVTAAIQKRQAEIIKAKAIRNTTLTDLAGSVEQAEQLYRLAYEYQKVRDSSDPAEIKAVTVELDRALAQAKGRTYNILAEAKSYAFEQATLAEATGKRFAGRLLAYQAAPTFYRKHLRYQVLEDSLQDTRKYVIIEGENDKMVYIVDLTEKLLSDVFDFNPEEILKK